MAQRNHHRGLSSVVSAAAALVAERSAWKGMRTAPEERPLLADPLDVRRSDLLDPRRRCVDHAHAPAGFPRAPAIPA